MRDWIRRSATDASPVDRNAAHVVLVNHPLRQHEYARTRMIILIFLLWNGTWWAIIGGLLHAEIPGGWWSILVFALISQAPLLILVAGFRGALYPSARVRLWLIRPFWYIQLIVPLMGIGGLIGLVIGLPFGAGGQIGRWGMGMLGLLAVIAAAWGYVGSRKLDVRHLDIGLPTIPSGLDGMRIVQLSDVHVGPHTSRRHIQRILGAVREAAPDLIAITGDQVDDYARDVEIFAAAFGGLSAPLGVYAVPGNHDIYAGWNDVRRGMQQMGITVLVNSAVRVHRNGSAFWVAGTGDPAGRSWERGGGKTAVPVIDRTLGHVPPGAFVLALAHNPALWPALAAREVAITLSGHTHHGQISIPRLRWSLASPFVKHAMGLHREDLSVLYVSPGTNYWGVPLRIGALPEVTVITLRSHTH